MMPRDLHPKPLWFVGEGEKCQDNFGCFPPAGEQVGQIADVYFGADLVTLDLWLPGGPSYTQVRFQFGAESANFNALVVGVPPCSGPVFMGRGHSYDFNLMRVLYRTESAPAVNGYPRANLVELKLVPWPTSLRFKKAKPSKKKKKGQG